MLSLFGRGTTADEVGEQLGRTRQSDSFRVLREMFGPSRQHRGRFECHKVFRLRRALPCSREACGSGNRGEPGEVGPSYCG